MAATHSQPDFERLLDALPASAAELAAAAERLAQDGEELQAESIIRLALGKHDLEVLRVCLANILIRQNRHKEAMSEMVTVLRVNSQNGEALLVLATCLMECDELERGRKMLEKARAAGADPDRIREHERRWRELLASSGAMPAPSLTPAKSAPTDVTHLDLDRDDPTMESDEPKKRARTLMGFPNTGRLMGPPKLPAPPKGTPSAGAAPPAPPPPRRLPPPPLQEGGFASLGTWDIDDGSDIDVDASDIDPQMVRLPDGGPIEEMAPEPTKEDDRPPELIRTAGIDLDAAAPDDMTAALVMSDDEFAEPEDLTAAIPYDEVDRGLQDVDHEDAYNAVASASNHDRMPSVEYDASFAAEAEMFEQAHPPPADLDDLPSYNADWGSGPSPHPPPPDMMGPGASALSEQPVRAHLGDFGNWDDISSVPQQAGTQPPGPSPFNEFGQQHPSHHPHQPQAALQGAGHVAQPPSPQAPRPMAPNEMSWELQGNDAPGGYSDRAQHPVDRLPEKRRSETAVGGSPKAPAGASRSIGFILEKKWPLVLIILVALVSAGFLGVAVVSGYTLSSSIETSLQAATDARATDTYTGYQTAATKLGEVATATSFMGRGFDRFVESTVPIPGLGSAGMRRRGRAELAATAALLEWRYETRGSQKAAEKIADAVENAPQEPMTAVAQGYAALLANNTNRAIDVLRQARNAHPDDDRVKIALAWAELAGGRIGDAAITVQPLRDATAPTVHQRYVLASVDAARADKRAAAAFADVFAQSPDHADARIARAYALMGGSQSERDDAERALDAVLDKLKETTSPYQKARATSAFGSLHLASGKADAGEESLRSAVAKSPDRGALYLPLLRYLEASGKLDEVDPMLDRARENNAYDLDLTLYETRLRILRSEPTKAAQLLGKLDVKDTRTAFWEGIAQLELHNTAGALKALEAGANAPGDKVRVQALTSLARGLDKSDAVDDALSKLEKLVSEHADDAWIAWAAAKIAERGAQVTTKRKDRDARLTTANGHVKRALELDATWAPFHFTHCSIRLVQLDLADADKACAQGRKLAPDYVPGLVTTARLRLLQGQFDAAEQITGRATKIASDDPAVGLLRARVAIDKRQLDTASKLLNKWVGKRTVDEYEMALLEGRVEFARENYTRAAGYLKNAYELRPSDGEASIYYGHTLTRLGDFKGAGKLLKQYLSHPTWSGYAWATLGEVRRKQRRVKDALENLSAARRIYAKTSVPKRYWSHLYTEYALTYQKKYRKWRHPTVKRMLDRGAKKGDPDDPGLNMTYGQYYLNLRKPKYDLAMEHIQRVVDVAPYRCDAVSALADLYERAKRSEDDRRALDEIRQANCTDK